MTTIILIALVIVAGTAILLWQRSEKAAKGVAAAHRAHEVERDAKDHAREVEWDTQEKLLKSELARLTERFAGVVSADDEEARVRAEILELRAATEQLKMDYRGKKNVFDALVAETAIFDERISFAEMGVYEPHFDYTDSEAYKAEIVAIRDHQKHLIKMKTAVVCRIDWSVDGSKAKGRTMTNRTIRLTLRAFNNECDAAIANVRWNNANAMEKRIERAFEQINALNETNQVVIRPEYFGFKLTELRLTHEYREKQKVEREERAELARLARDEQRLLRDLEQAQEDEAHYHELLQQAKAEAASIVGPKLDAFAQQIEMLERDLAAAHARAERAQAMAERTRSGYVYIISNIGSFGDGVVKIGLTRRLDPMDRVRELGDASVPFTFDTHAVIYSDDAPALERALHAEFDPTRINAQNYRKEFFRASIEQVEEAVARLAPGSSFFKDIEAQEYRETLARRQTKLASDIEASRVLAFPAEL